MGKENKKRSRHDWVSSRNQNSTSSSYHMKMGFFACKRSDSAQTRAERKGVHRSFRGALRRATCHKTMRKEPDGTRCWSHRTGHRQRMKTRSSPWRSVTNFVFALIESVFIGLRDLLVRTSSCIKLLERRWTPDTLFPSSMSLPKPAARTVSSAGAADATSDGGTASSSSSGGRSCSVEAMVVDSSDDGVSAATYAQEMNKSTAVT